MLYTPIMPVFFAHKHGTSHVVMFSVGLLPRCMGASSETRFKLKAMLSFSVSIFETGCFQQARVSLHRPTAALVRRYFNDEVPVMVQEVVIH